MAWLTWDGFYTAATNLATGLAGAGAAWFALRRRYAKDSSEITETRLGTSLLQTFKTERDAAVKVARESLDLRLTDAVTIATQALKLETCEQRMTECQERTGKAEARAAAAEEHSRAQAEELLIAHMQADTLAALVARLDPEEAARLARRMPRKGAETQ